MNKTPLYIITILISLVALANLARFFWNIPITLGSLLTLPAWTGAVAFIVLGLLAAWAFQALYS